MSRRSTVWVLAVSTLAAAAVAQELRLPPPKRVKSALAPPTLSFDDSEETATSVVASGGNEEPNAAEEQPVSVPLPAEAKRPLPVKARVRVLPATGVAANATEQGSSMRVDSTVPNMRVVTQGPDTLVVGKPAVFVVEVRNASDFDANAVAVRASIPAWVDLENHDGTAGRVVENKVDDNIEWLLESVKANGTQRLKLNLVPRKGKAFDLKVELAVQPRKVKRQITIKEPQLQTKLVGPDSVVFEEDAVFKLKLTNPGTATTENVSVKLLAGGREVAAFDVGTIVPGSERIAELNLSAGSVGSVPLQVVTTAEPGLKDNANHTFTVRRGTPQVAVTGSSFLFAGNAANYEVTVSNDGDADLKYVDVTFSLPNGAAYISGLKSPRIEDKSIEWTVDQIAPGASVKFPLVVQLKERGKHEFTVLAKAADDLVVRTQTQTLAETSADLKLTVKEPQGPQPVGQEADYEIRIANVGSAAANDISIIAVLPPELKAVKVSGDAAVKANQIFFRPIKTIGRDKDVVHTIRVKAIAPGNHTFRVVVQALDPKLRFSSEDTTRYFDRNKYPTSAAAEPIIKKATAPTPRRSPKRVASRLPGIFPK
jgi:uncharacterized repeat protein (TIGR01451 family)